MAEKGEIHTGIQIPQLGEALQLGNPDKKIQGTKLYLTQPGIARIQALGGTYSGKKNLNSFTLLDQPTRTENQFDVISGKRLPRGETGRDSAVVLLKAPGASIKEPVTSHIVGDKISLEHVWGVRIVNDNGEHVDIPIDELTTENPRKKTSPTGTKSPDSTQQPPSSDLPYPDETSGLGHEENPPGGLPLPTEEPKKPKQEEEPWQYNSGIDDEVRIEHPPGGLSLNPTKPKNPTEDPNYNSGIENPYDPTDKSENPPGGLPLPPTETPPSVEPPKSTETPKQEEPPVETPKQEEPPVEPPKPKEEPKQGEPPTSVEPPKPPEPPKQEEFPQRTHALIGYSERGRILDSARKMAREWMEEAQKKLSLKDFIRRITKHNIWKFWYEDQYEKAFTSLLEKTGSHLGEDLVAEIVEKARTDVETGKVKLTFRQRIALPLLAKDRLIFSHAADLLANDPRLADVRKAHEQASRATVTRFMDETGKLIHTKAGEHLHVLDSKDPNDTFILNAIRTRIQAFVTDPTMTEEQFQKNMTQFFQSPDFMSHAPADVTSLAEMDYFASSLLDVANQFRQELAQSRHEQGTQQLDEFISGKMSQMTIILGVASTGARTKVELTQLEKMQRRLKGFGGLFVNETTLGTAVAASLLTLGNTAGLFKSSWANAIFPVVGGSAVAGIFAGISERQKLTSEGMSHRRSREVGNQYDSTIGGRRQRILELSLLSDKVSFLKSATDIRRDVLSSIFTDPEHPDTLRLSATSSEDDVKKAITALSDARARIAVSDDPTSPAVMVSYSSEMAVEAERTALDLAVAQSEKALTAFLTDPKNEQIARKALGVPTDPMTPESTHALLATAAGKQEQTHKTTVAQAARAFGVAARNEAMKKGAVTFGVSVALGSVIRSLSHVFAGEQVTTTTHPTGNELHLSPQGTSGYKLPEHFSVNGNADLVYTDPATGRASMVMDNFPSHLGANGDINAAGISEAAKNGFVFGVDHTEQLAGTLFSGKTHELIIAGQTYTVPQELTIVNPDGDALGDIVIHASPINGQPVGDIIIAHNVGLTPDGHVIDHTVLDQINASQFLDVPPGTETIVSTAQHTLSNAQTFTDALGGNHIAHVTLPDNVHLTAAADGTYTMTNANHDVIASGIKFQANGEITNPNVLTRGIEFYNNTHFTDKIHYNGPTQESFTILEKDPGLSGNFTMKASEWDPHGGYWTYVEKTLNNNGVTLKNPNADVNAIKHLLRGYEQNIADTNGDGIPENIRVISHDAAKYPFQGFSLRDTIHGPELNYPGLPSNPLANDTEFTLSKSLFSLDAMKQIVTDTDKAIELYKNGVPLDQMNRLHQILWKVGYSGMEKDIPGKDDILFLMDHYGGGAEHQIQQVIFNQSFSAETVSHTITGVMPQGAKIVSYVASQQTTIPGGNNWWDYLTPGVPLPREPLDKKIKPGTPPIPEPPGPPGPPEPSLSGVLGENIQRIFSKRRSKTLVENPSAPLNPSTETTEYFSHQEKDHIDEVRQFATEIGPMPSSVEIAICIPVAGHQESQNIYDSLKNYTYQTVSKDKFEIILFVNSPKYDRSGNPLSSQATLEEINRFKRDFPDMPIRVIQKSYDEPPRIGQLRKILSDVVLYRNLERKTGQDILIASNDADNKGIAPEYLENFIQLFYSDPKIDGSLGQLDWDPEAYIKYPIIHIGTRLFQYLNITGMNRSGRMSSSGANFAYRGSIYAAIGGYVETLSGAEDVAIGQAIIAARGDHKRLKFAGAIKSRLYTNSRRAIKALQDGLSPIEQWNKGFSAFDDEVRKMQLGTGTDIDFNNPKQVATFKEGLEYVINRTLDVYESGEKLGKNANYYKRTLSLLGIRYDVVDNKVVITNMDGLIKGLQRYQELGVLLRDYKSGKGTPEELMELRRKIQMINDRYDQEESLNKSRQEELNQALDTEVQKQLTEIQDTLRLTIDIPQARYSLEELQQSEQQIEIDDYVICLDRSLGSGQMGTTIAGYHKPTGRIVAIKRVKSKEKQDIAQLNQYPEGITDIEDVMHSVAHSDSLMIYEHKVLPHTDTNTGESTYEKIYPLASSDLNNLLKNRVLPQKDAVGLTIQVGNALRSLHANGVLHLDLSPTNVLIMPDGSVKLTDYDAGSLRNKGVYHRGFNGGYMRILPPELFTESPENLSENADTYELGILLFRSLTGEYPYSVKDQTLSADAQREKFHEMHQRGEFTIPDSIPQPLQAILKKSIQPNQSARYQSVNEMLKDLIDAYSTI